MAAPEQSNGGVPEKTVRDLYETLRGGGVVEDLLWCDLPEISRRNWVTALAAALPAIHAPWQEKLEQVQQERDAAVTEADRIKAEHRKAEAALAQRDREVRDRLERVGHILRRIRAEDRHNLPARLKVIHQLADEALDTLASPPQQDPEVPRCGGSGNDPTNRGWEIRPGARWKPCAGCVDCQPTPERLAYWLRLLGQRQGDRLRADDRALLGEAADFLAPTQPAPGNSGNRLIGKQATVRLPECASEQGEPKTEIPFIWGFQADYGPTLDELREKALAELRKTGIEHHGRDLLPDADSPSPEHWRLERRGESGIENDFDLRFVCPPGNSGGVEEGCPFCDYSGPSQILRETGGTVAFEPLNPVTPGHVLVVPKAHLRDFTADPLSTGEVFRVAAEIASELGDCNLITSKGDSASQTVPHLHVHVVPRRPDDGLALPWTASTQPSSPPPEVEDCERCEGIGSLGFSIKPGGPQGFSGVLISDHCPDCEGTGKQSPPEPKADAVEVIAKAINPEAFEVRVDQADEEERADAREKARRTLAAITPLLHRDRLYTAQEVRELMLSDDALGAAYRSQHGLGQLRGLALCPPWAVQAERERITAALDTALPSSGEER